MVEGFFAILKEYGFLILALLGFVWRVEHRVGENSRRVTEVEKDRLEDKAEMAHRRAEDNTRTDQRFEELRRDMDRRFDELRGDVKGIAGDIKLLLRGRE